MRPRARATLMLSAAAAAVIAVTLLLAPVAQASFGIAEFEVTATNENGSPDQQAGSHPYALTTKIDFNLAAESPPLPDGPFTEGDVRDLHLALPPGLFENPSAVKSCSQDQFHTPRSSSFETPSRSGESCPDASQVGVVAVRSTFGGGGTRTFGIFSLAPPPGTPSELGFNPYGAAITIVPTVRESGGEYGLTLNVEGISQLVDIKGLEITLWGAPWVASHDSERGSCLNEAEPGAFFAKCPVGPMNEYPLHAYLTLPTSCSGPTAFTLSADSWQGSGPASAGVVSHYNLGDPLALGGCGSVPFEPTAAGIVANPRASSASGFDFELNVDDEGLLQRKRLAASPVKRAVVALPPGMTINPSVGAGLGVCTPADYAAEAVSSPPGAGCPEASKIGDFTVHTPLVEEVLAGSLYLAQPRANPFGSLLAVYLIAKAPQRGFIVKVAGELEADPTTGRLTAVFDDLPELPYSQLDIHFREGQRAPLATPASCGTEASEIALVPWGSPQSVRHVDSEFVVAHGIDGGPCPTGTPPFGRGAQAGTLNSQAGAYSPFYLHLTRTDGEAEITSYSATLPSGLLGKIAGVPFCPDAAIETAKSLGGVEEETHPSCPAASEIGHTETGYGLGGVLAYAPGELYLAGPFNGAPLSIVAIDAATVGPFDLGTIVIRSAIQVSPSTAQVRVDSSASDRIPHILDGIPLHLRDIRVYISKPGFIVNPTSCEPRSVVSSLTGSSPPFTDPTGATASVSAPFQVSNCSSLPFRPRLSLRLKGSTGRGGFPSLRATLTPRPGDANLAAAAVTLPREEFLAQEHIKTVCTRPQFARGTCPAGSVYGHAAAITPLLGVPLEGPVYLRSSSNPLPDLVAVLRGGGITTEVDGRIDSVKGGLRGTFEGLPDAPLTRFTMSLFGGKRGLLANERNVCRSRETATARFLGQNNVGELMRPKLEAACGKHKTNHKAKKGHR
jgi:hypothetical protein